MSRYSEKTFYVTSYFLRRYLYTRDMLHIISSREKWINMDTGVESNNPPIKAMIGKDAKRPHVLVGYREFKSVNDTEVRKHITYIGGKSDLRYGYIWHKRFQDHRVANNMLRIIIKYWKDIGRYVYE